jgi:hypothetical protein
MPTICLRIFRTVLALALVFVPAISVEAVVNTSLRPEWPG